MANDLDTSCNKAGILPDYYDIWGNRHVASDESRRLLLEAMEFESAQTSVNALLPPVWVGWLDQPAVITLGFQSLSVLDWRVRLESGDLLEGTLQAGQQELVLTAIGETGYHRLELRQDEDFVADMLVIICPRSSYAPPSRNRTWGLSVQLYALQTEENWGLGDYADLDKVIDWAAAAGASLVGLNPLHALFPHNPRHCSPYSPSSRNFWNVLHIGVTALPEFQECKEAVKAIEKAGFKKKLDKQRNELLVDYSGVAELKYGVLEILYKHFRSKHLAKDTPRAQAFRAFQTEGGEELRLFALYNALQEYFHEKDPTIWGWPAWPKAYHWPESIETQSFAKEHEKKVEWHEWLQWLADQQLASAAQHCQERGMSIGLYQDLAVGVDKGGAETWIHRDLYALDARVGCPPDDFNPLGQDWGLPPWIPQRLRAIGYAPYIAMLRANMKYAGALRIDHVMSLMRLYWIPPGLKGDAGAYVNYPFQEMLGILNLESQRNQCVIVGEDLGTVPDEVRHALREAGILSYKLYYFERQQDGHFFPADWFPEQALVAASTHDLPTLAGYWLGRDIKVRTELDLYPRPEMRDQQIQSRKEDRIRLLQNLEREGLLPEGLACDPASLPNLTPELLRAIHVHLARSRARIALVQAEDMLGQIEQTNQPGTIDEHPNWRRKLSVPVEAWQNNVQCTALAAAMSAERPAKS